MIIILGKETTKDSFSMHLIHCLRLEPKQKQGG